MTQPAAGKVAWKLFKGEPEAVIAEANAFMDQHDMQKFPVQQATTTWHEDGKVLTILLTIVAPPGAGKPDILKAARLVPPPNGRGA